MATKNLLSDPRVDILKNISSIVSAVLDMDQLMYILINTATKLTGAKSSSLLLIDEKNQKLHFFIAVGDSTQELKHAELAMGEGIAGWVAKEGKPVLIGNVKEDKRWSREIAKMVDFNVHSIACAPMKINNTVIGVIEIIDKHDGQLINTADLDILVAFADMAASFLEQSQKHKNISRENTYLKKKFKKGCMLIGESNSIAKVASEAIKVANTSATALIVGESGTGKELIAQFIHQESIRKANQMISINCGALPETMLERELFGHEKGSFTSADSQRIGLFEAADKGTLFLDEIGDMPLSMQVKLLRVLQEGYFFRLGSTKPIQTDVRIIAATNKNLAQVVREGHLREDLFYRLNVVTIEVPPLRERREDIPLLATYFVKNHKKAEKSPLLTISPETMTILINHDWPGNVRQLKNAIERAIIMGDGKKITPHDLPTDIVWAADNLESKSVRAGHTLKNGLNVFKKDLIEKTLQFTKGNKTEAAKVLDIERTYLSKLLKDLYIQ